MRPFFAPLLLLITYPISADTVLQAWAYVNLVDVPERAVSSGAPVTQSASGDGSSCSASASPTSISAQAQSQDANLTEGASATAAVSTTFRVTSRSGRTEPVPLTFNLGVSGSIHASSTPALLTAGPDVSVASVNIRSNVDRAERNGSILLGSQKGVLVLDLTSGAFGRGGEASVDGKVDWHLEVRLGKASPPIIPWSLLPPYLRLIGTALTVYDALEVVHKVVQTIDQKAKTDGFPDLGFPPGERVPLWQVSFGVDNDFPLLSSIVPNDGRPHFMGLSIIAQASSAPTAECAVDYSNTIKLQSVTVPASFQGDPSDITVKFETGETFTAKRAGPRRRAVTH